ncbi:MAG: hypothetical protein LBG50_01625 [Clostridiales Family XIII bacterium]|jgi:hypothetical protein|nr:hypothetical protein [Clostridiales Family XIII bacterium]
MDMLAWQKEQFSRPQEVIDIRAIISKQAELGRVLTEEEVGAFIVGHRTAKDGFTKLFPAG